MQQYFGTSSLARSPARAFCHQPLHCSHDARLVVYVACAAPRQRLQGAASRNKQQRGPGSRSEVFADLAMQRREYQDVPSVVAGSKEVNTGKRPACDVDWHDRVESLNRSLGTQSFDEELTALLSYDEDLLSSRFGDKGQTVASVSWTHSRDGVTNSRSSVDEQVEGRPAATSSFDGRATTAQVQQPVSETPEGNAHHQTMQQLRAALSKARSLQKLQQFGAETGRRVTKVAAAARPAAVLQKFTSLTSHSNRQTILEGKWLTPRIKGLFLLNVMVLLVASNWVAVKQTGEIFDPMTFASLRFLVAAAAFSPWLVKGLKDRTVVQAGLELGVWSAAGYLTQSLALLSTDASRASFISTFTVLVVPFLAGLTGRGVKPLTWVSAFVALFGVSLLEESGGAPPGIGDVWAFASAVAFGIQVFRTELHARRLPRGSTLPLMAILLATTAGLSLAATAAAHPAEAARLLTRPAAILGHLHPASFPWGPLLYTGLLSTDLALWIEVVALQSVSSVDAAITYTLEPVLGALLAYAMLGERWGPAGWVGAGLIVASSLTTQILGGSDEGESDAKEAQD